MKKLMFILIFFFPDIALGNPPDVRPHTFEDGASFVCFTVVDAKDLLQLRLTFEDQKKQLDKYKEWIDVKIAEIETLEAANGFLEAKSEAFQTENASLRLELQTQDSWWKNPYVWFTVGLVAGSGMGIAIFYAVKEG